jgi:hypothetical protein
VSHRSPRRSKARVAAATRRASLENLARFVEPSR